LLKELKGDGSPLALEQLDPQQRSEAFAPAPTILPATEILFGAWAMTTLRDKMPGRPPLDPYLHGINDQWDPPLTEEPWPLAVLRRPWHSANIQTGPINWSGSYELF